MHKSNPGLEQWKSLVRLVIFIKVKETTVIIIRKPKVLKYVMFFYYNYATNEYKRKGVSGLVSTIGGTILTCSSKTKRKVVLIITQTEYMVLFSCSQ